ncbi:hypothetical protein CYMTET_7949 [Cymbomonas tetramitiformis]|uniref:LysM domain-containing protein n=1 Tax=Cymbomonas tetramitiformis TaxID=36881 RepID=A0AAE0LGC7_9CHLO|nr:hypothetical protein CYMTET_7949 [Cymbomonas tetramitiformis]
MTFTAECLAFNFPCHPKRSLLSSRIRKLEGHLRQRPPSATHVRSVSRGHPAHRVHSARWVLKSSRFLHGSAFPLLPCKGSVRSKRRWCSRVGAGNIVAAAGAHVVQGGESLFTISKMYGTTVQKILASNDLGQDKRIKIGQTLIIPEGAAKAAPAEAVVNTKLTCEVKSGDTLSGIARRYGLSVEDLVKENQLSPDDALFVGDKLRVSITPPEPVKVVQLPVASVPNPPPTSVDSVVPNPAPQKVLTARLQAAQVELEKIPSLVTGWSQAVTTTMQANVPSSIPPNVAAGAGWAGLGLGVMVVTGLATRALGFGARAEPPPRQPQRVLPLKLGPDGQPVGSKEEPVRKQSGMRFLSDSLDKLVMNTESAAEDLMKKSSELREKKMEDAATSISKERLRAVLENQASSNNGTSSVNAPLNSNHLNGTGADSTINGRSADIHVKDEGTPTDAGAGNGVPIRSSPEEWYTKYTKDPVAKEPVAEEPMAEEPPAEEPLVEGPMAEEPLAEPVVEEPVAELAVAEQLGEPVPELVAEPAAEPVVDAAEQVVEPEVEPDSSPETELKPEAVAMQASLEQVAEQVVERLVGQATDEQLEVLLAEQSEPASAASTEVPGEAGDTASSGAAAWMEIVAEVPAVDTLVTRLSTLEDQVETKATAVARARQLLMQAEFDKEVAAGAKRDVLNEQTSSDAELGAQHEALSLLENAADEIRDQLAQVEEQMGGAREANRPLQQAAAQAEQAHADLSEQLEQAHSEEAALTAVAAEEEEKYLESKQNATTAQLDAEEAQAAAAAAETELAESPGAIRVALQEANMAVEASIQVREDVRKELSELAVRSVEASEAAARISTEGAAARRDAQQRAGELEEVEVLLAVAKESHETAEASVASLRAAAEAMSKAAELNPSQAALAKATLEAVTPAELEMRNWSLAMEQREEEAVGCRAAEAATAAAARNAEKKAQKAETEVELLNGQLEQTQWKSEDATAAVEEAKLALQRTERDGAARMAAAEKLVKLTADEAPAKVEVRPSVPQHAAPEHRWRTASRRCPQCETAVFGAMASEGPIPPLPSSDARAATRAPVTLKQGGAFLPLDLAPPPFRRFRCCPHRDSGASLQEVHCGPPRWFERELARSVSQAAVLAAATLENATLTRAASREAAAAAVAATMELVPQLAVAKELAERQRGEAEAALAEALAPLTQRTAELETILQVADHKVELAHQGVARSEKSADESMKMAMANAAVAEDRALDSWQNAVVHLSEVELEESAACADAGVRQLGLLGGVLHKREGGLALESCTEVPGQCVKPSVVPGCDWVVTLMVQIAFERCNVGGGVSAGYTGIMGGMTWCVGGGAGACEWQIAAHEALSEAAVALQRAQATGDSIATMEAAQQVTHARWPAARPPARAGPLSHLPQSRCGRGLKAEPAGLGQEGLSRALLPPASDAITSALGSTLEQWRQESAGGPPDVPAGEAPEAAAPEAAPEPLRRMAPRYEFEHVGNSVGLLAPAGKRLGSKALLVYIPGLDGTGQGIRRQLEALLAEGFDVRSVCIPHGNRSDWAALAAGALPLIQDAVSEIRHAMEAAGATTERDAEEVHVTLVAESFFAPLGLTLAAEAPTLITSLVLINPSTRYRDNSPNLAAAAELASGLGLLEIIPTAVYEATQDIVQALLVRSNSMNQAIAAQQLEGHCYPVDIPAATATWRLSLLQQISMVDATISGITQPVLLLVSNNDRVNPSLEEGARLQQLLPNSTRVVYPDIGHTPLLEDHVDLSAIMRCYGFGADPDTKEMQAGRARRRKAALEGAVKDEEMDQLGRLLAPWKSLSAPLISGLSNLPDPLTATSRPVLFVGNHSSQGLYDLPLMVHELYLRGFYCRTLAHPGHWLAPSGQVPAPAKPPSRTRGTGSHQADRCPPLRNHPRAPGALARTKRTGGPDCRELGSLQMAP